MGISVTPKQRDDVERQLRRTDLTRRVRERTRDGQSRVAGRRCRAHRPLERALGRNGGALVGAVRRRRRGGAVGCGALGPACAGGCGLSSRHGMRAGDATGAAGLGLRRVDVRAAVGLLGTADGSASLAGLVADALGAARRGLRAAQAHAQAPARPRRGGCLPRRAGGGGGTRGGPSRSATNCSSRTRPIWRPIPTWLGRGIARANNQRCPASGSLGASRCLAASKRWDARGWNWCAWRRTAPDSCALWSSWRPLTKPCSGRSIWSSIMGRRTRASSVHEPCASGRTGCT